jgi:acyl dehydratase
MSGKYFEEFEVGQVIEHVPSRTVTETDNVLFTSLTMNPQPLHLDHEFARTSGYGRPLVNGLYTLSLMMGLTVYETTLGTTQGNLGFEEMRFTNPVFVGDTLTAVTEVLTLRGSDSRPETGIVEFEHRCVNQDGVVVLTCRRAALMLRAPAGETS